MYIQLQNFGMNSSVKSMYYDGIYECVSRIHQFPEIVCIIDGEVEITVDGVTEIAVRGDIAVITPFRVHSFRTPKYCKIWIGVVSSDFTDDFLSGDNVYMTGVKSVFTPTRSLFDYLCEHLPPEYDIPTVLNGDEFAYKRVKAIVYPVLEEYMRMVTLEKRPVKACSLASVLMYVANHYTEDISLASVAEAIGYTPTYISHAIALIPNMNFRRLLNSMRVDRAKPYILRGNLKMVDVALECGFSCERSFNRAFREIVGMTPREYRRTKIE
ncbi:MAG: AraC family transcriptional regulator [Ruminococcaceae bacterium]|nr:AraC family transcriptional regulator [Oscillospiraceae bacterium]